MDWKAWANRKRNWGYTGCPISQDMQIAATVEGSRGIYTEFRDSIHCIDAPQHIPTTRVRISFGVVIEQFDIRGE
jgi:hypothetical protein